MRHLNILMVNISDLKIGRRQLKNRPGRRLSEIQQLIGQIKAAGDAVDTDIELPKSWQDFANWADVNLAGRVVLSPQARRQVRSPEFEDVEVAARCLLWLATACRDRRMKGGEGSLRDEAVEDGIRNAHCGADQFDLDWQGQRQTADWHIKNGGNTRDPKRCLRIYYFWHEFNTANCCSRNARTPPYGRIVTLTPSPRNYPPPAFPPPCRSGW